MLSVSFTSKPIVGCASCDGIDRLRRADATVHNEVRSDNHSSFVVSATSGASFRGYFMRSGNFGDPSLTLLLFQPFKLQVCHSFGLEVVPSA